MVDKTPMQMVKEYSARTVSNAVQSVSHDVLNYKNTELQAQAYVKTVNAELATRLVELTPETERKDVVTHVLELIHQMQMRELEAKSAIAKRNSELIDLGIKVGIPVVTVAGLGLAGYYLCKRFSSKN